NISLFDSYGIIWDHICGVAHEQRSTEWWADRYIWQTAMPHAVAAIVAGAGLAVCGALMQALMANPLADPYSTGISSGACFGAVSSLVVGSVFSTITSNVGTIGSAFIGAMIPTLLIIILAEKIRMTPATLILMGTAISYFFNSLITYLMISTDADTLKNAYMWQIGHLDGISWGEALPMVVVTIVGSIFVILMASKLNVISLGDASAKSLGLDVRKFRVISLALMSVMTAGIVSFTGIIGFIGLVAPHIVRLILGSDNKFVVPLSMILGALLLLIADYLAYQASELPVGVIMSVIGSPVFFAIIVLQSRRTGVIY
ncbi:MAG: iron ABC transporter permease, partial [Candidatus Methanomethylophilaceae archaeon]|nr:iron ABC transporter permease [Candidatus Methanomethylophilaceae archaeon]